MIKSLNPRRIITAGGTLFCALGIGYFMQLSSGENVPAAAEGIAEDGVAETAKVSAVSVVPLSADETAAVDFTEVEFDAAEGSDAEEVNETVLTGAGGEDVTVAEIQLTSAVPEAAPQPADFPNTPMQMAMLGDQPISDMPAEEATPAFQCEMAMTATPVAAAMAELDLKADCMPDTQFTLHHNGLMISGLTDADGNWTMTVPALAQEAIFIAAFDNGEGAVANATLDMLDNYSRYVVQWKGQSGLQIHAKEYGADYGEEGHVWADAARDMTAAARGEGGFTMRLGEGVEDAALMAEVYTFPTGTALRDGNVELSLEAEVNAANCGRDIEAQVLIKSGGDTPSARDLMLAMPDCDAVGDFLVLKNLYEDLKIARN